MIDRHFHWQFLAYDHDDDQAKIVHVLVEVMGYTTEENARIAAQDIVQRQHYGLRRVWECATCGFQEASASAIKKLADQP